MSYITEALENQVQEALEAVESGRYEEAEDIAHTLGDKGFSVIANQILTDIELAKVEDQEAWEMDDYKGYQKDLVWMMN